MSPKNGDFWEKQLQTAIKEAVRAIKESPDPQIYQTLLELLRESKTAADTPKINRITKLEGQVSELKNRLQAIENLMQAKANMRVVRTGGLGTNLGG